MNAHIRKRQLKTGASWQVIVEQDPDPFTGQRNRIYKTCATKKEAEKVRAKMLNELNTNTFISDNTIVLKTYMDDWLETYIKPNCSPTTIESYRMQINNHLIPTIGGIKLQDLKTSEIQKLYNGLFKKSTISDKPLAPKTIKNIHMNLHACLDRAVIDGLISKNPSDNVVLPKGKKQQCEVYDMEETKRLLEAAQGTSMELIIIMLVILGLRRGELLALKWSDIDFEKGTVNINKNLVFIKGERIIKEPKTQSGNRIFSVPSSLIERLKKEQLQYKIRKMEHGRNFKDNDLVICRDDGEYYNPDSITKNFERLLERKGLRHIRLHDLRHINATMMLGMDISPKVAQKRLGHSNFNITMDTYSHVLESFDKEAVDKIDVELNKLLSSR